MTVTDVYDAQEAIAEGKRVFFKYNGTTCVVLSADYDMDLPVMLLCRASGAYESCNLFLYAPNGFLPSVAGDGALVNLFPKMLPGENGIELDSVILNSSPEGNTKKFKITVDDSGTISATEV